MRQTEDRARMGHGNLLPRGDVGAAAVEFTFLFVFLFLPICYGTLSAGIVFSDKLALTQGVREAARYGATLPYDPLNPTMFLKTSRDAAKDADYGQLTGGEPGYCVAFRQSDGTDWHMKASDTTAQSGICAGTSGPTSSHVLVVASKPGKFDFVLDEMNFTISSVSVARYEGTS